ncbi:MAG: GntR family transcriptional regulator [Planctomycetales bacterium]|nr:GntR family transcriptional regulator [Planctomycetales bacterium]MCA9171330.1 GntR family transcriptional regulator [Planctomycetales bacterium]
MQKPAIQFEIHPSSGVPIYLQIIQQVRAQMASGRLAAGQLLPSVRQMAATLEVNMMTISKAYSRLEADGLLERVRGTGMRIRPQAVQGSVADRRQQLRPHAETLATHGQQLGLTDDQIIAVLKSVLKERKP